MLRADH